MDSKSEKIPVRLSIFNQTFSLLVSGDPADMERAADQVDDLMNTIARGGNADTARVAVLACLHLQDRLTALERELSALKSAVDDKARHFSFLLDQVIEEESR